MRRMRAVVTFETDDETNLANALEGFAEHLRQGRYYGRGVNPRTYRVHGIEVVEDRPDPKCKGTATNRGFNEPCTRSENHDGSCYHDHDARPL